MCPRSEVRFLNESFKTGLDDSLIKLIQFLNFHFTFILRPVSKCQIASDRDDEDHVTDGNGHS